MKSKARKRKRSQLKFQYCSVPQHLVYEADTRISQDSLLIPQKELLEIKDSELDLMSVGTSGRAVSGDRRHGALEAGRE